MARQGYLLKDAEVHKMVSLLGSTDMTISEIAERLNCSRSAVSSVNRKFQVRDYRGHRTLWVLKGT
jgi:predicted transcriptional regulator